VNLCAREGGPPSVAMATFVRLRVVKQRTGWGYETLVREVSVSSHPRGCCLIGIDRRVPDESTVRQLVRRLGSDVVDEITRMVIQTAQRETRFMGRAARIDGTVVEADFRYPSDAVLAWQGARALARDGKRLTGLVTTKMRIRSMSFQSRLRPRIVIDRPSLPCLGWDISPRPGSANTPAHSREPAGGHGLPAIDRDRRPRSRRSPAFARCGTSAQT
jgi:hypothetical protein